MIAANGEPLRIIARPPDAPANLPPCSHYRSAFGRAEEAPSLTAAARDGDGNMRSGRKNARSAGRTKAWNDKGQQKWRDAPLTKKAPYKPYDDPRGGGNPHSAMAAMPAMDRRLQALPAEAYDCFMVGTLWVQPNTAWFARLIAANGRLPSDHRAATRSPAACRRGRVRQGPALGGAEEAPAVTAAARIDGDSNAVGRKVLAALIEQVESQGRQKCRVIAPLTKKAPYKPDQEICTSGSIRG